MTDHTHRVVGKQHLRSTSGGLPEVFEVGDELTPSDAELRSFPYRFEALGDGADEPDGDSEDTESSAGFTAGDVEDAEYTELREMASAYDDISGNASADELRDALADKV